MSATQTQLSAAELHFAEHGRTYNAVENAAQLVLVRHDVFRLLDELDRVSSSCMCMAVDVQKDIKIAKNAVYDVLYQLGPFKDEK